MFIARLRKQLKGKQNCRRISPTTVNNSIPFRFDHRSSSIFFPFKFTSYSSFCFVLFFYRIYRKQQYFPYCVSFKIESLKIFLGYFKIWRGKNGVTNFSKTTIENNLRELREVRKKIS